ncbi:hypothetical protein Alches_23210 [Alicyclobacillus hesperidum subsp. aegles]|uniref:alkaline phosphatase family protein n=1 Tax=Alicyclobacillus hesperidum TaxID=89784 RepID=UPI00222A3CE1|nr:alkaline phosphatase family protein [Alicyclobacillus hesperidum]GLG02280.1 hypothetical protein Alches_23210 [Alicyclobacillus hesperidum subsp. aegles]
MRRRKRRPFALLSGLAALSTSIASSSMTSSVSAATSTPPATTSTPVISGAKANTPIQHVIVLYDENVSFDHYFGTYPNATNPVGEPPFYAAPGTPTVNGLTAALLTDNPNLTNPKRLDRSQALTGDNDHGYTSEQEALDGGLVDKYVQSTGHSYPDVMDYFDGNTVTALWNYAQHYALNDNFFGTDDGPSTPGALNLISGQTHGATAYSANEQQGGTPLPQGHDSSVVNGNGTIYNDQDPYYDDASSGKTIAMTGTNIGDVLNQAGLTWGWFQGGYDDTTAQHANIGGKEVTDYVAHHEPYQYYDQTSNVTHVKPSSVAMIGHTDQANHQYDLTDFWTAVAAGNVPNFAVLKPPAYEDGHPGYSDPLDEQQWLVQTVNKLESLPTWKSTAIFITYDDSDGWYDHVMPPIVNQSDDPSEDALDGTNSGTNPPAGGYQDRAGYGPRLPLIVISPYAKHNEVINSIADQSSIIRFVEDNWNLGRLGNQGFDEFAGSLNDMFDFNPGYYNPPVFLDPNTGEPVASVTPFTKNGQLYMDVNDLAQSLDVQTYRSGKDTWFTYGGHLVGIPANGDTVTVDGNSVQLGAPIVNRNGAECLPIDNLATALGVKPIQYQTNSILFQPIQSNTPTTGSPSIESASYNASVHQMTLTFNAPVAASSVSENDFVLRGGSRDTLGTATVDDNSKDCTLILDLSGEKISSGDTFNLVSTQTDITNGDGSDALPAATPVTITSSDSLPASEQTTGTLLLSAFYHAGSHQLTLTFTQPVSASSVAAKDFDLMCPSGNTLGTVTVDSSSKGNTLVLDLSGEKISSADAINLESTQADIKDGQGNNVVPMAMGVPISTLAN